MEYIHTAKKYTVFPTDHRRKVLECDNLKGFI